MPPTNIDLLARRVAAVPRGVGHSAPVFAARAQNAELWDVEGKRYIDFAGGIAVLNVGHRHPKVMAAVAQQLELYAHTAFQVTPYEPYIALCERLNALAPFTGPAKTLLVNSGAEAVENAIKISRAATGKSAVIAFSGGFHGRTLLTMALTGKIAPYKKKAGPMPAEIFHAPFPSPHLGVTVDETLQAIATLFKADIDPERLAAIIIEPVQGEGGFHDAPPALLRELRKICDTHGALLIADEVQCGFARTGRMFGIEHSGVEPDLVTVAKSLGGGFPIAGVIGKAAVMDVLDPGGLGSTYGGHPVSCAAALAVLDIIADENLIARANALGERMKSRLAAIARRNDIVPITAIRGLGAMIAFDVAQPGAEHQPDAAQRVAKAALADGLVILTCGIYGATVRVLVPLTAPDVLIDEGMAKLEAALASAV